MIEQVELISVLIKTALLSSTYATLTLLTFKLIGKIRPNSWFGRVAKKDLRLWFLCGLISSIGLFAFRFTHYGDYGYLDLAKVPIGHSKALFEHSGEPTRILSSYSGIYDLEIYSFFITNDFVYGLTKYRTEKYFLFNLEENILKTYKDKKGFDADLIKQGLDKNVVFKSFSYYYKQYWGGLEILDDSIIKVKSRPISTLVHFINK